MKFIGGWRFVRRQSRMNAEAKGFSRRMGGRWPTEAWALEEANRLCAASLVTDLASLREQYRVRGLDGSMIAAVSAHDA